MSKSTKHKRNKLSRSMSLSGTTPHGIAFRRVSHGLFDLPIIYEYFAEPDRSPKDQASHSSNSSGRDNVTGAGVKSLSVEELRSARTSLIPYVQHECSPDEVARLKRKTASLSYSKTVVKKSSSLAALSPFMGDDGLLRVGGWLDRAELSFDAKHLAIIPSKHHIVDLLIRHYHKREGHSGARAFSPLFSRNFGFFEIAQESDGLSTNALFVERSTHCPASNLWLHFL